MFIENSKLLVKKAFWKKISVSVDKSSIEDLSFDDILKLSKKELLLIQQLESYKKFCNNLYDKNILKKVLEKGILYKNLLDFKWKNTQISQVQLVANFFDNFPQYFIYESNKTEWSRIPFKEFLSLFKTNKSNYKNKNEIQEVKNSKKAWDFLVNKFVFNKAYIKKLYHILTKNLLQETGDKYPRWFRKVNVIVGNSQVCNWKSIDKEIDNLILWYKENKKSMFPLQLAFDFHLKFEKIHPFENWNWRVGRFLLNKILLSNKFLPIIVFSANREAYFNSINFQPKSPTNFNQNIWYFFNRIFLQVFYISVFF